LSDSGSNSDDDQAGADVSNDGSDDSEEDNDNEDWVFCGKMTTISVRYHLVPHLVVNHLETDKCLFFHMEFSVIFSTTLFEEIATETNRYVKDEIMKSCLKKTFDLGQVGR
jgi:hypothetical protein